MGPHFKAKMTFSAPVTIEVLNLLAIIIALIVGFAHIPSSFSTKMCSGKIT